MSNNARNHKPNTTIVERKKRRHVEVPNNKEEMLEKLKAEKAEVTASAETPVSSSLNAAEASSVVDENAEREAKRAIALAEAARLKAARSGKKSEKIRII